jgi:hypothetical protein
MAHATVFEIQETSHEQIKNQDNCHIFFYSRGVVHKEFVPPGVTVNKKHYLEALGRLRKRLMYNCAFNICLKIVLSHNLHS